MANLGLKVSDVIEKFYNVQEDTSIKGLYAVYDKKAQKDILWYFFSSNNATYHSSGNDCVIRDINQSNSQYIDRLKAAYEKAEADNKKFFWLVLVYGEGIGLVPQEMDWMASIELRVALENITASLRMTEYPIGKGFPNEWRACRKRCEEDKYFRATFMSCKDENGEFTDRYMKDYFEIYDNRPYRSITCNENSPEDAKLDLSYLPLLKNREYVSEIANLFKQYDIASEDVIKCLKSSDWSKQYIKRDLPIFLEIDKNSTDEEIQERRKDKSGNRYYETIFDINGKGYLITNNWFENDQQGRMKTKFAEYLVDLLSQNGISATISNRIAGGANILLYGVPGAGKSYEIKEKYLKEVPHECIERVVFHPDYSYSDFVGQIAPRLKEQKDGEKKLTYEFIPGPFTVILKKACLMPNRMFYLVIEEINRGNAPAIFGEIFQLLDRTALGESEYGISNYDVASYVFNDDTVEVKIPSNLTVLATMNTADQNVFTLDTAFQRRWIMRHVRNDVMAAEHANRSVCGSQIDWGTFASVINEIVLNENAGMVASEDKRLGAYFAQKDELTPERFSEKVIKYLWDDAFRLNRDTIFSDRFKSLDSLIESLESTSEDKLKMILRLDVYGKMLSAMKNRGIDNSSSEKAEPKETDEEKGEEKDEEQLGDEG